MSSRLTYEGLDYMHLPCHCTLPLPSQVEHFVHLINISKFIKLFFKRKKNRKNYKPNSDLQVISPNYQKRMA